MATKDVPSLMTPLELAEGVRTANRMVMPPLVIWRSDKSGRVKDYHLRHYSESAPGAGLVIVEATCVSPEGRLAASQLGIFEDSQIPGLTDLARLVSRSGAIPGIQLHHAGGRSDTEKNYGRTPVAPSAGEGEELTEEGVLRLIGCFITAGRRAVDAGFKLLEIHGAHGYLGSQFLSPRTNRRQDRWGGSLENRLRFLTEIVGGLRRELRGEAIVSVRLGVAEKGEDGLLLEEGVEAARSLEAAGCEMIHVSHGGSMPEAIDPDSPFDPLLQLAGPVKEAVSVPVIGIGGIRSPEQAQAALSRGVCDLVASGRAILADPGYARKIVEGKTDQIVTCVQCKPRCFHYKEPARCPTRNHLGIQPPGL
ncbi:MAG: tRNA-dihydrouridine synthase [Alkalispirochaetaceae bacterium]